MNTVCGTQSMAKQGRSVQLPPDVYVFAEAYESRTGIKFNRQIVAALLRFFFEEFSEYPNNCWIGFATGVERGSMKIEDLPLQLAKWSVDNYESEIERRKRGVSAIPDLDDSELKSRLEHARGKLRKWEEQIREAGSPRKAVLKNINGSVLYKLIEEYNALEFYGPEDQAPNRI